MAELPHIGQQCFQCNRLDFLPVICSHCKKVFCKDHLSIESHQCPDFASSDRVITETPEKHDHEKCDFCSEIVKNRLEMVKCDRCSLNFCLTHRHPEGHNCSSKETSTPARRLIIMSSTSKPIVPPKGPKGAKNEALAKKVNLMKLKQSSIGLQSIPQSERFYFHIDLGNQLVKPVFFSSFWSIGKAVDYVSSKFNLTNNNNKVNHPKLVIATDTITFLPFDVSLSKLAEENKIENGQKLYMKYIEAIKD